MPDIARALQLFTRRVAQGTLPACLLRITVGWQVTTLGAAEVVMVAMQTFAHDKTIKATGHSLLMLLRKANNCNNNQPCAHPVVLLPLPPQVEHKWWEQPSASGAEAGTAAEADRGKTAGALRTPPGPPPSWPPLSPGR